jgi:hypothetical protein
VIDKTRAREIVLLALESADDILVGLTSESYKLGQSIEALIAGVSEPAGTTAKVNIFHKIMK